MRKIIIVTVVVLGVIAAGLGVYFAWKKTKAILTPPGINEQPAISDQQSAVTGGQAGQAAQKLKVISDQPVFDYWIFDNKVFYLSQQGKISELKGNKSEVVSAEPILDLQVIKSSANGKRTLIKSGDAISPKFTIFNSEAKIFEIPPENIAAAAFSPDAKKIAYWEKNSGNLVVKDLADAKSKTTKIMTIFQKDFDLEWILPEKIVLAPKPSAFYRASAWVIDVKNKTLNVLGTGAEGLIIKWSASGKTGIQFSSRQGGRENRLNLINEQGMILADLDFITLPEKCLIADPQIYCAMPQNIPPKAVLPDDYFKRAIHFRDILYQIDVSQNSFSEILAGAEPALDVINLKLAGGKLFFINRYDSNLYQLEL